MKDDKFGFRTRVKLMEERKLAGGTLAWDRVDEVIQACYDDNVQQFSASHPAPKKKRSMSMIGLCDDEWLSELEANPAYSGVDIKRELGKCQVWMRLRGRPVTRRTFVNWINKAERTIGVSGEGRTSAPPQQSAYEQPSNWMERAKRLYPEADFTGREWAGIPITIRAEILRRTRS